MALFDLLIWIALTIIFGGSVGIGMAKLISLYEKKQDIKKVFEIIEEKTPNNLKLDGKMIDVNKFTYKEEDGELKKKVTFADIVKETSQKPLRHGNKGFFWRFWKKKEMGEKEKK